MRINKKLDDVYFEFDGKMIKAPNPKSSVNTFQRNNIKWTYPEFLEFVSTHYEKEPKWMGKVWLFYKEFETGRVSGLKEPPKCDYCHMNYCVFGSFISGYSKYCSSKCSNNVPEVKLKKFITKRNTLNGIAKQEDEIKYEIASIEGKLMKIPLKSNHHNMLREVVIKKRFPEFHNYVLKKYIGKLWMEKLYCFFNNISETPICPVCGKTVKFLDINIGYSEYCSRECSNKIFRFHIPTHTELVESYGNTIKLEDLSSSEIPNLSNSNCAHMRKNYIMMNFPKFYLGLLNKYPMTDHFHTMLYMYSHGFDEPLKCKCCGKYLKVTRDDYGFGEFCSNRCASKVLGKDRIEKMHKTFKEKTGYDFPLCVPEIQTRLRKNNLEKYGVEWNMQRPEIKQRYVDTRRKQFMEKYPCCIGFENDENGKVVCICKCTDKNCDKCKEKVFKISSEALTSRYKNNIELCTTKKPLVYGFVSQAEFDDRAILDSIGVEYIYNDKKIINPYELDIYCEDQKIAIEENGAWCHCYGFNMNGRYIDKKYHMRKWEMCFNRGIELVCLWSDWSLSDKETFLRAKFNNDWNTIKEYKQKWFPDLSDDEWPIDLGFPPGFSQKNLKKELIREHQILHEGLLCYDSGIF